MSLENARALDAQDPLASFRDRFVINDPGLIYVDGNSLGRMPKAAAHVAGDVVHRQWADRLIRSWGERWWTLADRIGGKLAGLVGARADEVIVADSTSVNLYKLVLAALGARAGRHQIITDDMNFPSDHYILQGAITTLGGGHRLDVIKSADGVHGPAAEIKKALSADTALVTLSHVVFKSAYVYDMADITRAAHDAGALVLWDLSHSAGSVRVPLNEAGADLAVGCTYKYLNGGPGAPAYLYVRRDLQDQLRNPISGWWAQKNPFDFDLGYTQTSGIRGFMTGTMPVASTALVEPGVDVMAEAGLDAVRAKSIKLTEFMIALYDEHLKPLGYSLNSPRDAAVRGSHVSVGHPEGYRIYQALMHDCNVIPDFRAPDNIRLGLAPLYISFEEVFLTAMALKRVVAEQLYAHHEARRTVVT